MPLNHYMVYSNCEPLHLHGLEFEVYVV